MRPSSSPFERSSLGYQTPPRASSTPIHRTLFNSHLEATEGGITPIESPSFRQQFSNAGSSFRSQLEATESGIAPLERTSRIGTPYSERGVTLRSRLEATEAGVTPTHETSFRPQIRVSQAGTSFRSELEPSEGGITLFDRICRPQIQVSEPGRTGRSELEATRGGITPLDRTYRPQIQVSDAGRTVRSELGATSGGLTPFDRTYRTQIQIPEAGRTVRSELEATEGGVTPVQQTRFRPHIKLSGMGTTFRSHLEPSEGGIAPSERTPFRPRSGPPVTHHVHSDKRYCRSRSQPSRARVSPAVGTPGEYSQSQSRRTHSPCVCPSNRRQTYIHSYPTVSRRRVRRTPQQESVAGNVDDYQEFLQADLPQGVEELLDTTAEFEETESIIQFEENEQRIGEVSDAFQQLGQIDAHLGDEEHQVCRPCTASGSCNAQVSDSGRPTCTTIIRRRISKEVVGHRRKSREKISRPAKSQIPSNRRMHQGVPSSPARFSKPVASSTPLKTPGGSQATGRLRNVSPVIDQSPSQDLQQRGASPCGVCLPVHQQSKSRGGVSQQLDDRSYSMQVPQTGSVRGGQRRNVPFVSDLSPERPQYPVPQTRGRDTDILSGITSDVRDLEEPPPPLHEEEPPDSMDRTVEMDAEREAEDEIRQIQESLGPGADEFQMVEALIERGVPEEVVSRRMARMEGAGRGTRRHTARSRSRHDVHRGTRLASRRCSSSDVQLFVQSES